MGGWVLTQHLEEGERVLSQVEGSWGGYHPQKDRLRGEIWQRLKQEGVAVGDPVDRIPNFVGAGEAAVRLASLDVWQQAKTVKCNPDSPQIPVRLRALQEGKRLYMAVPRLTDARCFVELTAEGLQEKQIPLEQVAIAHHALSYGRLVSFAQMQPIDLAVVGCVAVARNGGRTGKGAGFADLELAMLRMLGLVQATTPIVTTVHPLQIVADERLPMLPHDWLLNWVVTAQDAIAISPTRPQPTGLDWDTIRPEQYQRIPILQQLRRASISGFGSKDFPGN
ncbi:5-formyltetrahydrofolate cyclo-ligase [Desertifilum sp. FACHB-1129]|nr:5-formyltetrahydrofolate cyclo-ligase [Desertifilum sp. FACHB-1129]MBD2324719.1 5-formyltetrahydrofolate cyclo-ligase [Desertifilum sp. FACHB-866]MBD2334887.1 5-formyltetrahydrofolate cyclo-ligase [Desertifilum sp. FACHB-868]